MPATDITDARLTLALAPAVAGAVSIGAAIWLHIVGGWTFPPPWDDEAHFIVPALELAHNGSLSVPLLNAPDGIFWLPHGYYVFLAPVASLPGDVFTAARWSSFACVVVFAASMALVAARRGVPQIVAVAAGGAWLLLPRVVVAGNVARMEAPLMALIGITIVLAERARWPAAIAVGLLAVLLHPIGVVIVAVNVVGALVARPHRWRASRWDWALLGLTTAFVVADAIYMLLHADVVVEHLRFQLQRKSTRGAVLTPVPAVVLTMAVVGIGVLLRRIIPTSVRSPFVLLALLSSAAGMLVAILGQELWYEVLGVELSTALLILVVLLTVSWTRTARLVVTICLVVGAAAATWGTLHTPLFVYEFRASSGLSDDWPAFAEQAVAALEEYDGRAGPPEVVLIDSQSALTPYLHGRSWNRLRFVQTTPVTPFAPAEADLLLVAPGPTASPLYNEWGPRRSVISTASPQGQFKLLVMPH